MAQHLAKFWVNERIVLYSDSMVTVACINKRTSRNKMIMRCLRRLFWLSATYNFHLTACHLLGCLNSAADSVSRLHSPGHLQISPPIHSILTPVASHVLTVSAISSQQVPVVDVPRLCHKAGWHLVQLILLELRPFRTASTRKSCFTVGTLLQLLQTRLT